jgi:hypothetical protein
MVGHRARHPANDVSKLCAAADGFQLAGTVLDPRQCKEPWTQILGDVRSLGDSSTFGADVGDGLARLSRIVQPVSAGKSSYLIRSQRCLGDSVTLSTKAAGGLASDQITSAIPAYLSFPVFLFLSV